MIDIEAIKTRAEAATKGPWASGRDWGTITSGPDSVAHGWHETTCPDCNGTVYTQGHVSISVEDLEFITASRTDIPALIAEVERLRGIVDRVREVHAPKVQTVSVPVFDEFDSPTQTDTYCAGCGGWGSSQKLHRLCPTIRALDDQ